MKTWYRLLAIVLLFAWSSSSTLAQSSPPPNPNYTQYNTKADGDIPTPPAGKVRFFYNGTNFRFKTSAGAFTDVGGAGLSGLTAGKLTVATAADAIANSRWTMTGGSLGTATLYDDGGTGVTSLALRAGANQATAPSPLLSIFANDGTTRLAQFSHQGTLAFNQAPTTTDTVVITPVGTQSTPLRIKGAGGVAFAGLALEDPFGGSHLLQAQANEWTITGTGGTPGVQFLLASGTETVRVRSASDGGYFQFATIAETITLDTAGAVTDSAANLLPANSILLGLTWKITTEIQGIDSTTISFGDGTTAARFSTGAAFTVGTNGIGITQMSGASGTAATGPTQGAAAKLRITLSGGADNTPTQGAVRVIMTYMMFSPPA